MLHDCKVTQYLCQCSHVSITTYTFIKDAKKYFLLWSTNVIPFTSYVDSAGLTKQCCRIFLVLFKITYLFCYFLTHCMEQSSWEANQFSASQVIPCNLWNLKVHCCIHKCLPPARVLSQIKPVHAPTSHFLKSHNFELQLSINFDSVWLLNSENL